ncbi:sugar ABC transporter substrate-binding protein [Georgenia subflava]|uniref:Extracellular solute-binding protein n=1 Tax=Georgenia subflava TaxID=1622177 RepID=A0A6N7EPC2_9MICO|nr:sugar ABC transporter substrate-binding protein [Georgenia subflava]MPV38717.1 extracellular solute-binding protein [Georgenia subflava]
MRRRVTVAAAAAIALTLAACGGGGDEETPAGGDGTGGTEGADYSGETLDVWIMEGTNPDASGFFDEVGAAFEEQTGATLNVEFQPWASAHDKFVTSIAGGTGPDVAEVGTTWTPEFAEIGALEDLTPRIEEAGLDADLVEGLVEAGTFDGGLYGMPWYAGVRSIIYNTEIFETAGITEPPTSWDELLSAVEAIKSSQPDVIPFPVPGDSQYGAYPFIWGAGGEIAEQEGETWTATINSPESVEGLEFYTGLALEHDSSTAAATTWNEAGSLEAFMQGNVGMIVSGSWTPGRIAQDAPDLAEKIAAFPIPAKDGGVAGSFLGGSHLGVFSDSENPDLAWEFVELMTTGEFADAWASQTGYFPGQASLMEEKAATDDPLVAPFAKQMLEGGRSVPVTPIFGQIQGAKTVETMLQSILSGGASVQEAADTAAADMDEIFAGS